MLKLFNSLGKGIEPFHPANPNVVTIFTCGPSVYQRAHIGNFRTFLFEDVLVRYLEYSGYAVARGMNFTDLEDKTIEEANKRRTGVKELTEKNIAAFLKEMRLLGMKIPDYLPRASESVNEAVALIERLIDLGIAYRHKGNVYFDPLKFPGFGKLYGLDMAQWPRRRRRFHKDTYPGIQWNRGDFIIWHGYKKGDRVYWDTNIGKGRPAWNIQDPAMISPHFHETLSLYCGGIDNLYRHHDYTLAILESLEPYPMAKYWLHCRHLTVHGHKMSKSKGNVYYTDTLLSQGYTAAEIRFFLICGHYRMGLNYSDRAMFHAAMRLRELQSAIRRIRKKAGAKPDTEARIAKKIKRIFSEKMDGDLNVQEAFTGLHDIISGIDAAKLKADEAAGIIGVLEEIDMVLKVIF